MERIAKQQEENIKESLNEAARQEEPIEELHEQNGDQIQRGQ